MKSYEIELANSAGVIHINTSEIDRIYINIRYGPPIDDHFDEYSWGGHYRCEILNGNIIYEVLPQTTNYDLLRKELNKAMNELDPEVSDIIIKAFALNKNNPTRYAP